MIIKTKAKIDLTIAEGLKAFDTIINNYCISKKVNQLATTYRCIDDTQLPFEVLIFSSSPTIALIHAVSV